SYLIDYEEIDGGFVAFGGSTKGGKITRKDFKLTDESHVLLKVPRKDNMYSVDLKNVIPQGVYGCVDDPNMPNLEKNIYSDDDEDVGTEADMTNLDTHIPIIHVPTTILHKDHPHKHIIRNIHLTPQTRRMPKSVTALWNKKDKRGIMIRNKARLVAQGYTKEAELIMMSWDVKSAAFCMKRLEEEVSVCKPPSFEGPYSLTEIDIILEYSKKVLCIEFEKCALEVLNDFNSQDKYVDEILKMFGLSTVKIKSTPMETLKPLMKDESDEDVDVHLYRSMIASLMYLTSSRPDIMFVVCACARFQVTPKVSHLYAVKIIFRYLKSQPKLGLWYPKDSPFDLEAYTDSDYAGASLDRKSTT
ncbi:hypothetical protein Tco_0517251, partial [Tanacetum coccineum]